MSDKETCTICLDTLFPEPGSIITRIQPCGHYYHSDCIDQWKKRSNICPTCREEYDFVDSVDDTGTILSFHRVTKVDVPDDDFLFEGFTDIEMEDVTNDSVERRINLLVSVSNTCILCDSRGESTTPCNTCSSSFHYHCLGLNGAEFWTCPMCDAEQRATERPSRFRRSRNSAITNRVYNQHRDLISSNFTPAISSEIIEAPEPMSIEEQHSWESFELAKAEGNRNQDLEDGTSSSTAELRNTTEKKRLKKPTRGRRTQPVKNIIGETPEIPMSNNSESLVNKILGQMKENRTTQLSNAKIRPINSSIMPQFIIPAPTTSRSNPNLPSLTFSSPQSSFELSSMSPSLSPSSPIEEDSSIKTNKSAWKMSLETNELTYEQKLILQGIVRSKLRPLYQRGDINEEQYTKINKKVSHILYDFYLKDFGDVNPSLEAIAEHHIAQEVNSV